MIMGTKLIVPVLLSIAVSVTAQNIVGSPCVLNHNSASGTCRAALNCPKVVQDWQQRRITPTVCGWQGFTQIVCCQGAQAATTTTTTARTTIKPAVNAGTTIKPTRDPATLTKSERYCQQYQQFVYDEIKIASLIEGEPARVRKVDRCGHKTVPLIVGGTPAKPKEFPHMALIGYANDEAPGTVNWDCGGSLVSERWVLTAGHCSKTSRGDPTHVRLGEYDKAVTTDDARTEDFTVTQNIPHPNYLTRSVYNDIALLQLDRSAKLSPYVRPICLPTSRTVREGSAIASGWGRTGQFDDASDQLLKVILERFQHGECSEIFGTGRKFPEGIKDDTQLCAGSRDEEKDTCQGDSGGPLQVYHPNEYCMYTIIGVTSFGKACGTTGTPGVYSRVYTYVPWIESIIWPN